MTAASTFSLGNWNKLGADFRRADLVDVEALTRSSIKKGRSLDPPFSPGPFTSTRHALILLVHAGSLITSA